MIQMTHILVLSQPEFVERQLDEVLDEENAKPARWSLGGWLRRRAAAFA